MRRTPNQNSKAHHRFSKKHVWFFIIAGTLLFFGINHEWLTGPTRAPNAPASHDDILAAARSMRQHGYQSTPAAGRSEILLGKRFFFDPRFSESQTIACATCHDPQKSFTDGKRVATGMAETAMNTPTIINVRSGRWFFHNGRADSLEMQALGPMENPKEHGFTRVKVFSVIRTHYKKEYEELFGKLPLIDPPESSLPGSKQPFVSDAVAAYALGTLGSSDYQKDVIGRAHSRSVQPVRVLQEDSAGIDTPTSEFDRAEVQVQHDINQVFANFGAATAAFERTIRTEDSPFDRFADRFTASSQASTSYVDGFGETEWNGFKLFVGEGRCVLCHHGPDFTDHEFHNIGLPAVQSRGADLGRAQGLLLAQNNPFFCAGKYFQHLNSLSEACAESRFAETENSELIGAFKTPTLRNLQDTAPYGHDGRFTKLRDVLIHYNLLTSKPAVGHTEESLKPLGFSDSQLADLEAFLRSLYGTVVSD